MLTGLRTASIIALGLFGPVLLAGPSEQHQHGKHPQQEVARQFDQIYGDTTIGALKPVSATTAVNSLPEQYASLYGALQERTPPPAQAQPKQLRRKSPASPSGKPVLQKAALHTGPVIGIIIDDMGNRYNDGMRALQLPGKVTYSVLPHTPYSKKFARIAHAKGRDVMLHQPMEAMSGFKMGPGGLDLGMAKGQFQRTLVENLRAVPHVTGINNHMGSLMTAQSIQMGWLMEALQKQNIFFVDSRTSERSVAYNRAIQQGIPNLQRHVFLDHNRSVPTITAQYLELIKQARERGYALAIGHPYPETMSVLEAMLPRLQEMGIQLVPVSQLILARNQQKDKQWLASSSHSQTAAKNLKR